MPDLPVIRANSVGLSESVMDPLDQQAMPNDALLSVRALRTDFPLRRSFLGRHADWCRAVDGVDLDIARGETLGLVGESGCGKTTLARTVLRLIEPTSGSIRFDGMDVLAATGDRLRRLRRNMQVVFQDSLGSLDPRMTIGRSIEEPLLIHRVGSRRQRRERVAALLEQVGMLPGHAERYPHELSGGQRQRVNIARAIALRPKFIVCDEPVSALDGSVQAQVLGVLSDLKAQLGLTMLFISHDLAVVRNFCDRVAVMYLGKIVEIAAASEIFERAKHPYTMALRSAVPEPDPTRRRRRPALSGDVPTPTDPAVGCAFSPRCPFATETCRQDAPTLRAFPGPSGTRNSGMQRSGTQLVACHHAEDGLLWEDAANG